MLTVLLAVTRTHSSLNKSVSPSYKKQQRNAPCPTVRLKHKLNFTLTITQWLYLSRSMRYHHPHSHIVGLCLVTVPSDPSSSLGRLLRCSHPLTLLCSSLVERDQLTQSTDCLHYIQLNRQHVSVTQSSMAQVPPTVTNLTALCLASIHCYL